MPGGCKSILNVKCLHKSHMAELFGLRVFCFSVGQKKSLHICFATKIARGGVLAGGRFSSLIEVLVNFQRTKMN